MLVHVYMEVGLQHSLMWSDFWLQLEGTVVELISFVLNWAFFFIGEGPLVRDFALERREVQGVMHWQQGFFLHHNQVASQD